MLTACALLCVAFASSAAAGGAPKAMELESSAFEAGGEIPLQFACSPEASDAAGFPAPFEGGENVTPPLEWSKPPKGTKEIAILVDDVDVANPDDPEERFVHWGVWRLKPKVRELEEGTVPSGAREIEGGYLGPCPPEPHTYEFQVFALKKKLDLDDGTPAQEYGAAVRAAVEAGQVLGRGSLEGLFTPPA
jgi:Raf kinase inhibitor-like YbhB/YbcL family protein